MTERKVKQMEMKNPGIRFIDGSAPKLQYAAADGDNRLVLSGVEGMTILTKEQVKAVAEELLDVYEMFVMKF